jgi:phosphoglycolate phosphatase-like HAD superfamily hydrolase/uridine kinase
MIKPNDVNLIIFDLDGTIVMSQPLVYEAIKRAFKKLDWPVTIKKEEINRFIGVSTASTKGTLYEFITPPNGGLTPDEVRELVRLEYPDIFRTQAVTFPGVKETLAALRKRGYKLAQYTNASTNYLETVMSGLGLRPYYDYVECIEDNHLTKNQLAAKIKKRFGLEAAIVGDRCHDTEAARENGCLAVGALFGYGEKEPEAADVTIKQFSDLLTIFDRRLPVFERINADISSKKQKDRAFVIGINGIDCSGKSTFAKALESYLKAQGRPTQLIAIDDFHNPQDIRYSGSSPADNYYHKSFNIEKLVNKLLKPVHERADVATSLNLLNLETDEYDITKRYSIRRDTIVILEGVFLFRKELADFIDYKIYLDIPFNLCRKRARERDDPTTFNKYDEKYLPAQRKYILDCSPLSQSEIVIDNSDPEYPKVRP